MVTVIMMTMVTTMETFIAGVSLGLNVNAMNLA
jgi:hypothetical protein